MIYKIPIYFEVKVEGDFVPGKLSESFERVVTDRVYRVIKTNLGESFDSKEDLFNTMAETIRKKNPTLKRVKINLISKIQVFERLPHRD